METESRLVVARRGGKGRAERLLMGEEIFWDLIKVAVAQYREYKKNYWVAHFKLFILGYLNFTSIKKLKPL